MEPLMVMAHVDHDLWPLKTNGIQSQKLAIEWHLSRLILMRLTFLNALHTFDTYLHSPNPFYYIIRFNQSKCNRLDIDLDS